MIVGIFRVDIVDAGHQVGKVDSLVQHSEKDVVRNVCHYGHARKGRYETAPEKTLHSKLGIFFTQREQEHHLACLNAISTQYLGYMTVLS